MDKKAFMLALVMTVVLLGCPPSYDHDIVGKWTFIAAEGSMPFTFRSNGTFTTLAIDGSTISGTYDIGTDDRVYAVYSARTLFASATMTMMITVNGDTLTAQFTTIICEFGECDTQTGSATGQRLVSKAITDAALEVPMITEWFDREQP